MKMQTKILYKEVYFDVNFNYQPSEDMVHCYSDGSGYSGCSEAIEGINSFTHKGTCFMEFLNDDNEKEIDELIIESIREL